MDRNQELFTPDTIDDDIDLLFIESRSIFPDTNSQFIRKLHSISKDDAASLTRVWERLEHYNRLQHAFQELGPRESADDRHVIPFQSKGQSNTQYPARPLFTVLAAAIAGLFLVSSLAWILAIKYTPTPTAIPNHFVQVPLLKYFNNKGIGNAPGHANFDGAGAAYPANELQLGNPAILDKVPYQFPRSNQKGNDNITVLRQTTIQFPQDGNYQQAFLLVASSWGNINNMKIVVHYKDGSTSSNPQSVDDWDTGSDGVVNTNYHFSRSDKSGSVHIYVIQIPMDRTKRAYSLSLHITPNLTEPAIAAIPAVIIHNDLISDDTIISYNSLIINHTKITQPNQHIPRLHIFALTLQS